MAESVKEANVKVNNINEVALLFGSFDSNIKLVEKQYGVNILNRSDEIKITGKEQGVLKAVKVINKLIDMIKDGEEITEQSVNYLIELVNEGNEDKIKDLMDDVICFTSKGKAIRCKTIGQKRYVESIQKNDVVFGIGPAGTGKTYLAIAMAVSFLKNKRVSRIVLTRPAVEAGEKLGFLPGDLQEKIDPYLRPLYDSLYDILGIETFTKYMESGVIEVAPLAYMRGRTLDDSFIILDEAQNTTPEQMKMLLTRFGFGSRVVVTGDITQIDLGKDKTSGLKHVIKVLKNINGIDFVYLTYKDVVRHRLVMEIIKAYERYSKATDGES
ncbi:MAG: PhoH family protein [Clostridiales bacterium]|nr:PhoH family protein [Clostridiales bacterium]